MDNGFLSTLVVESIRKNKWKLVNPLIWQGNIYVVVPEGFETDFASIPEFAGLFGFDDDDQAAPAVLHDWLYKTQLYPRKQADLEFLLGLKETGCGFVRRRVIYSMVRAFGWAAWKQNQRLK